MSREEQINLHCSRASAELDRAFDAETDVAAEAHFGLSHLHRARIKALADTPVVRPHLRLVR